MTIKAKSDSCDAEFIINDEATIHEYMDVIIGALIADGFNMETIAEGLRSKLSSIGDLEE